MTTFRESYDIKKVAYALEHLDTFLGKEAEKDYKKQVKYFLEEVLIKEGKISVDYKYAHWTNYGRRYAIRGIQGKKKEIRNFLLAGSNVKDYDISSAHPTILYYLCLKHNIRVKLLKDYVFNKEEIIKNNFQQEVFNKEDIKNLILTATNSDEPLFTPNKWIKEYQEEMEFVREELKKVKDYKNILKDTQKIKQDKNNQNSSFVNRILCSIESKIIDSFVKLTPKTYKVFALMFDGLLVENGDDELLHHYNYIIHEQYGDYFKIVEKPIITDVDMGDYEPNIPKLLSHIDSYETRMNLFIDKFKPIKIINPPLYGIIQKDGTYEFYKKDGFIQSVEHLNYTKIKEVGSGDYTRHIAEKVPVVNEWLIDKINDENTYESITTDPTYEGSELFNLWTDWDIKNWKGEWTDDVEAVEYMKNHIRILCNNEENVAKEMELWLSHLLKYPKNKSFVPIFVGGQGAGKDMFFSWIEMMIGANKKFESCSPEEDVWGHFNPFMKSAYLIHLSEFGKQNTGKYVNKIKAITTTDKIQINEKNKGQYIIPSFHRFIGASQSPEPITIETTNRRFLIILTSPEKINDPNKGKYFEQGWGYTKNKNAIMSMYNYLTSLETPEQYLYHNIDETEYMTYLKFINKPQEELWLSDFCKKKFECGEKTKFKNADLYRHYKKWCNKTNQSYTQEKNKFFKQLKFTCSQTTKFITQKRCSDTMYSEFDWDNIKLEGRYIKEPTIHPSLFEVLFEDEDDMGEESD